MDTLQDLIVSADTERRCDVWNRIVAPTYPELPADLRVCFSTTVAPPSSGVMTKKRVMNVIAKLKKSKSEKTDCGKCLIASTTISPTKVDHPANPADRGLPDFQR
ncbi:hypothetical protein GCM10007880_61790 [Mesorhizobium amorphae]|nr:hypothetical protein GCM10007880_61790 [Mesorhizobium amorphae]